MLEGNTDFMGKLSGEGKFSGAADLAKLEMYLDAFGYNEAAKAQIISVLGREDFVDVPITGTKNHYLKLL